jgi:hypothetical protein
LQRLCEQGCPYPVRVVVDLVLNPSFMQPPAPPPPNVQLAWELVSPNFSHMTLLHTFVYPVNEQERWC